MLFYVLHTVRIFYILMQPKGWTVVIQTPSELNTEHWYIMYCEQLLKWRKHKEIIVKIPLI